MTCNTQIDLLNCPFCQRKPSKTHRFCMGFAGYGVSCKCGAETPKHLTDEDAYNWWNRRITVCEISQTDKKFKPGDHVRKKSGSEWQGYIVGEYSTDLTPEGYAVESETHKGSVQIYPAGALEMVPLESSKIIQEKCPRTKKRDCPICGKWLGWIDLSNPSRNPTDREWQSSVQQMQAEHDKLVIKDKQL